MIPGSDPSMVRRPDANIRSSDSAPGVGIEQVNRPGLIFLTPISVESCLGGTLASLVDAIIGFGSNLGERETRILEAAERLGIARMSPLYETAPMYVLDQPAFLNAVGLLQTELGPVALLKKLKEIETAVGRLPRVRNGPREIDLDLLAYGKLQLISRISGKVRLHVPHPRVVERRFVLQPLFDLDPAFELPGLGRVGELLQMTESQAGQVVRLHS